MDECPLNLEVRDFLHVCGTFPLLQKLSARNAQLLDTGAALAAQADAARAAGDNSSAAALDDEARQVSSRSTLAHLLVTLAYVALVDKLQSVLATPLVPAATVIAPAEGRTSLFNGDDAGIGRCAAELASFYDSQLRDAEAPQDVLRVMDLDADALDIDTETRSMVFGS